MRILVLAEHNNEELKPSTFSTINAANQIDSNVDVLVIGFECESVTKKLSNITNIKNTEAIYLYNTDYQDPPRTPADLSAHEMHQVSSRLVPTPVHP